MKIFLLNGLLLFLSATGLFAQPGKNMLKFNFATMISDVQPSLNYERYLNKHFTAVVQLGYYLPWGYEDWTRTKGVRISPEIRYYFAHEEKRIRRSFYTGIYNGYYQIFYQSMYDQIIKDDWKIEGFVTGVTLGYTTILATNVAFDFNIGFQYSTQSYQGDKEAKVVSQYKGFGPRVGFSIGYVF